MIRLLWRRRSSDHVHPPAAAVKRDHTLGQGEQREIAAHADIAARMELRAALADDDAAGPALLPAVDLDAQPFRLGITAVLAGTLTFLMSHYANLSTLNLLVRLMRPAWAGRTTA